MATAARKSISISELRANAGKIVLRVNQTLEPVDVTVRGQVIARIVPATPDDENDGGPPTTWDDIDRLAEEIGRHLKPDGKNVAEVISEARR